MSYDNVNVKSVYGNIDVVSVLQSANDYSFSNCVTSSNEIILNCSVSDKSKTMRTVHSFPCLREPIF